MHETGPDAHPPENGPCLPLTQLLANAATVAAPDTPAAPRSALSARSRFTILRLHAQGGLGQVSLAQDEKLNRPVALKEIRPEWRRHASLRQRFLTEAEITGQLEHPGIVPIYDLEQGPDGEVRYAMRFIQGRTLEDAIAGYHGKPTSLGFRELLARFVSVCQTVAYAHSQGVIHRDLKPANVILGDYGETLVVDWGLAKRLNAPGPAPPAQEPSCAGPSDPEQTKVMVTAAAAEGPLTQAGHVLGTPAFMAPEQAAGAVEDMGPATDIFSLGAILYCVLTGRPPYQGATTAEVVRAAREGQFPPPTQVRRGVPPALEAVCSRALARAIPQRYASAVELARDVERWLADERVSAYPEPLLARVGRFARRHRHLVASAAALLILAVIALAVGLWAVDRERARTALERDEKARALVAETQAHEAEAQARQLAMNALSRLTDNVVEQHLANRPLTEEDRRFLRDIQRQYEEFAALPGEDDQQRSLRAAGRYRVGLMQYRLGETKEAATSYQQAIALLQPLTEEFPSRHDFRRELAACHGNLGSVLHRLGQRKEAEDNYTRSRALWRQLVADYPTEAYYRRELAVGLVSQANFLRDAGRRKEAEAADTEALAIRRKLAADFPRAPELREAVAASLNSLGPLYRTSNRPKEAEAAYREAQAILQKLATEFPNRPRLRQVLASTHNNLGVLYQTTERLKEAEKAYIEAVALLEPLAAELPRRPGARTELAAGYNNLGVLLRKMGREQEALAAEAKARTIQQQLSAEAPSSPEQREFWARSHHARGLDLSEKGRLKEAEAAYIEAQALRKQLAADFPKVARYRNDLAGTLVNLALLALARGDFSQSRRRLEEAQPHHQAALEANPGHATYRQFYRNHLRALTRSCAGLGDHVAAGKAAARLRDLGWEPPLDAYHAACALALCVPVMVKADLDGAESDRQAQLYADQAMIALREAVARGFKSNVHLKKDPSLDPLRKRADFQKLLLQVEGKTERQ